MANGSASTVRRLNAAMLRRQLPEAPQRRATAGWERETPTLQESVVDEIEAFLPQRIQVVHALVLRI
jgi:hypothetical protein